MKSTSFRLTDEALSGLRGLAERYHLSQAAVLELLILDRVSVSDMERNKARRDEARKSVLATVNDDPRAIFQAGYRAGWLHFQTRHGANPLVENI